MNELFKYYGKIIYFYDPEKKIVIKKLNDVKDLIENKRYVLCFKIINKSDFKYNDLNISQENFPWKTYYKLNKEIFNLHDVNFIKNAGWNHWKYNGKYEERAFSFTNNTNVHRARFGNIFFLNMCLHLFSIKYNLKSSYKHEKMFDELGINFYKGSNIYNENYLLTDYNFENLLESNLSPKNIIIDNDVWFHTNRFCKIIKKHFEENNLFKKVVKKNHFKSRYNNNNDLFIHIRLGDVSNITKELLIYFENTIKSLKFNNGFIASDSINHEICSYLINKYNLSIINENEVKTIMFGSTCKHIILSGGTFSWLIGFLSRNSNVFYPDIKTKWFGNIFNCSKWKKITLY